MEKLRANELIIGNLIQWEDESNEIVKVTGIYLDSEMDNKEHYAISFIDPNGITENDGTCFLDEFIPITLTEEWLLKFGFTKLIRQYDQLDNDVFKNGNLYVVWYNSGGEDFMQIFIKNELLINIIYVHQLQNIIFALTGEELKIKEK